MKADSIHVLWKDLSVLTQYKTGVSLHSHTQYSKEWLDFVPRRAHSVPGLSHLLRTEERRFHLAHGEALNYASAWWTPPLGARRAYELEREQIENDLGMRALVSLTDHDDIDASITLHVLPEFQSLPVSLEWTVPFRASFLHVGVHNLPVQWANVVTERLASYTCDPRKESLTELFSILHGLPSVLTVLNHPLWDEHGIGAAQHRLQLLEFLAKYKEWIHALEINGLRSWAENLAVSRLACEWGIPVIAGGDRHGLEPNAIVNVTNAGSFAEFVAEVRNDRRSEVLLMRQYREPVKYRILQTIFDVLGEHSELGTDRRRWTDRVFFRHRNGEITTLSTLWKAGEPTAVKLFLAGSRLLKHETISNVLRIALASRNPEFAE